MMIYRSGHNVLRLRVPIAGSLSILGCLLLLSAIGCGGDKGVPPLGTVTGVVTLDGKPLVDATVAFAPEKGRISMATTDAAGRYELIYDGRNKGAVIGWHRVLIDTTPSMDEKNPILVPPRYNAQSVLTADVKAGVNTFDFALQSK